MKPYHVKRVEWACLALILLGGLGLRLAGLRWGLPNQSHFFSYHPDEAPLLSPVWNMVSTGNWDPHFYNYGTFYIYLVGVIAKFGEGLGLVPIPRAGWTELHLLARVLTALMGALTVYLVYLLGRSLGGIQVGLGSAALLAVLPGHVINSHYATVDVPATLMLTLLFVVLVRLSGQADIGWYLVGGLVLGLAVATKYTMVIAVLPFLASHVCARDQQGYSPSILYLIAGLGTACLSFLAVTPFLLVMGQGGFHINPEFVRDVKFEMAHMRVGGTFAFVNTGSGWVYHLLRSLPAGMGYVALIFGLVGVVVILWRGGSVGLVLMTFALPYFVVIGAGKERFLRYTIPLLPVLSVAAVYTLERLRAASVPRLGKWKSLPAPVLLGIAIMVPTTWYCWQMVDTMVEPDARTQAAGWLQSALFPKASLGLASTPWYFTPPITPFNGGLRSEAQFRKWQRDNPAHQVVVIGWDAAALGQKHPSYFAVSDAEYADLLRLRRPDAVALMAALPKLYPPPRVFEAPPPLPALRPDKLACPPDWLYTWPRIEVYYFNPFTYLDRRPSAAPRRSHP